MPPVRLEPFLPPTHLPVLPTVRLISLIVDAYSVPQSKMGGHGKAWLFLHPFDAHDLPFSPQPKTWP